MRAIGFRQINTKRALEKVLREATDNADTHRVISVSKEGENIVELRRYYAPKLGLAIRGYYDEHHEFVREFYYPFVESSARMESAEVSVNRHMGRTSFAGSCDDILAGMSMIFYLQNGMDFVDYLMTGKGSYVCAPLSLVGLSSSGIILLPVNKSKEQMSSIMKASKLHKEWINAAKNGDEAAIENLTMEDFDLYSQAVNRIKKEDIFTVVDSTFMPYGVECDHYMVMGDILEVKEIVNSETKETIYYMMLMCKDIVLNVAVNAEDLTGEPMVGRRFKGNVWLQGNISFAKARKN